MPKFTVKTIITDDNGRVIKQSEKKSTVKMTPNEKSAIYAAELSSGKSLITGEELTNGQVNYRRGYIDGLLKTQFDYGYNAAKKESKKKKRKNRRKRSY